MKFEFGNGNGTYLIKDFVAIVVNVIELRKKGGGEEGK